MSWFNQLKTPGLCPNQRARLLSHTEEVRPLILLVILGSRFLSLPLEIRSMILASAIGGQLINVSVRNPSHLAYIHGTWSPRTKLKLESCKLNPPKPCDVPGEDGDGDLFVWPGEDVSPLNAGQWDDYYICKESPL